MTVFELIKELSKYNHDAEVVFDNGEFNTIEIRHYTPHTPSHVVIEYKDAEVYDGWD